MHETMYRTVGFQLNIEHVGWEMGSQIHQFQLQDWHNKRKSCRNAVKIPATLMVPAGPKFNVDILDLSATGFRIETANYLDVGRRFYLVIPDFQSMQAKIAWSYREFYGCEFTHSLHPSVFTHIAEKYPTLCDKALQDAFRTNTVPAE